MAKYDCPVCAAPVYRDHNLTPRCPRWASLTSAERAAELKYAARTEFLDGLAELMAAAIQAGVTEPEMTADFEAQLSIQNF